MQSNLNVVISGPILCCTQYSQYPKYCADQYSAACTCVLWESGEPGAQKFQHCPASRVKLRRNIVHASYVRIESRMEYQQFAINRLKLQFKVNVIFTIFPILKALVNAVLPIQGTPSSEPHSLPRISPQGTGTVTSLPFNTVTRFFLANLQLFAQPN